MKQCIDCTEDISHRGKAAKRCEECQKMRQPKIRAERALRGHTIKNPELLGPKEPFYNNLKPCPKCGVPTANRYKCSVCWDHTIYDDEGMDFNTGQRV